MKTSRFGAFTLALTTLVSTHIALAHETDCPVCTLPVVQNTDARDNETLLKLGRKTFEYRCVYCAMSDAQSSLNGDLRILAPSETKGKPVEIARINNEWKTADGVVFVAVKANHKVCQDTYRAFSSREAFDAYAAQNKETLGDVKPVTLAEMVKLSAPQPEKK
jgi:hypothetical protein